MADKDALVLFLADIDTKRRREGEAANLPTAVAPFPSTQPDLLRVNDYRLLQQRRLSNKQVPFDAIHDEGDSGTSNQEPTRSNPSQLNIAKPAGQSNPPT
jgi:hypothetical protein